MNWNTTESYNEYLVNSEYLKSNLGITVIDSINLLANVSDLEPEFNMDALYPYFNQNIIYLNSALIKADKEGKTSILDKIDVVREIFKDGTIKITYIEETTENDNTLEFATSIGFTLVSPFDKDRFVFTWTNFYTALIMRLMFQYPELFSSADDNCGSCCCSYAKGQTTEDYESWTSGVYSEDEGYDRVNYSNNNSNWSTTLDRTCGCYRDNSDE